MITSFFVTLFYCLLNRLKKLNLIGSYLSLASYLLAKKCKDVLKHVLKGVFKND